VKLYGFIIALRLFCLPLMLMTMMAEMRRVRFFMLAIHSGGGPRILERQRYQQENEEEFFHNVNHSTLYLEYQVIRPAYAGAGFAHAGNTDVGRVALLSRNLE
jgi:hypothetical protein